MFINVCCEDWGQEEKGMPDNEMVGWHHWLNGHEIEQSQDIILYYLPEFAQAHEAWYAAVHRVAELDMT